MEKKLFKKLNEAIEIVKIENSPITEEEKQSAETKVVFEDANTELLNTLNLED